MTDPKPVIIALDYPDAASALAMADRLDPKHCRVKVGKELFTAAGPQVVQELVDRQFDVFLDLKFHDIPNTVAKAVTAAAELGVWMVNVHASGGSRMLTAAREALVPYGDQAPKLIAVTVLTSMSEPELQATGVTRSLREQVLYYAEQARAAGLDGVVCAATEAGAIAERCGNAFLRVTPGIRPSGANHHDQERVRTPVGAVTDGATHLVMGRPVREHPQPQKLISAINQEVTVS